MGNQEFFELVIKLYLQICSRCAAAITWNRVTTSEQSQHKNAVLPAEGSYILNMDFPYL